MFHGNSKTLFDKKINPMKRNWAIIGKWLGSIASFGFIYLILGQRVFFEYLQYILFSLGAIAICVMGYYGIKLYFQKRYPIHELDPGEMYDLKISSFYRCKLISEILIILGSPIGGFLFYKVMVWFARERLQLITGVFVVPIDETYWMIPAFFAGILFGILLAPVGMRILLRGRYKSFIKYLEIFDLKVDSRKLVQLITMIGFLVISIFVYIGLASYTRFTEEGIYTHRANQLSEEFHPYTQVVKIEEQIRRQKSASNHKFRIQLSDGCQWEPMTVRDHEIPESYPLIMRFVSQKSGQPFDQLEEKN